MATERIRIVVTQRGAERAAKKISGIGLASSSAERSVKGLIRTLLTVGAGAGIVVLTKNLGTFRKEMAAVKAISDTTEDEFRELTKAAKDLGAVTQFSAVQAAEGMRFLARTGFDAGEVLAGIQPVLLLAEAGMLGVGESADIATNVLKAFRLETTEFQRVVDNLAKGANSANSSVEQLAHALSFVAPIAKGVGVSLEETTAAILALSDAGLQGSRAGTGLRRVIGELESPSDQAKKFLKDGLGLSLKEVSVSANGLIPVLKTLVKSALSTGDGLAIFGDRGGPAFEVLASGVLDVERLVMALDDAGGTAKKMAGIMADTPVGAAKRLFSALQDLVITIGDLGATDAVTEAMNKMAKAILSVSQNVDFLSKLLNTLKPLLIGGAILAGISTLTAAIGALGAVVMALPAALLALQAGMAALLSLPLLPALLGAVAVGVPIAIAALDNFKTETTSTVDLIKDLDSIGTPQVLLDISDMDFGSVNTQGIDDLTTSVKDLKEEVNSVDLTFWETIKAYAGGIKEIGKESVNVLDDASDKAMEFNVSMQDGISRSIHDFFTLGKVSDEHWAQIVSNEKIQSEVRKQKTRDTQTQIGLDRKARDISKENTSFIIEAAKSKKSLGFAKEKIVEQTLEAFSSDSFKRHMGDSFQDAIPDIFKAELQLEVKTMGEPFAKTPSAFDEGALTFSNLTLPDSMGREPETPGFRRQVDAKALADLIQLKEGISGVTRATNERAAAVKILDDSLTTTDASGEFILSDKEHAVLLGKITQKYMDALNPVGALNRALKEEQELIGTSNVERNILLTLRKEELEYLDATGSKMGATLKAQREEAITIVERAKAYEDLRTQLDPIGTAMKQQAEDIKNLEAAVQAKTVTDVEAVAQMKQINLMYRDAVNPMAMYNRLLKEEHDLLGMDQQERSITIQLRREENELIARGIQNYAIYLMFRKQALILSAEENKQNAFNVQMKQQLGSATERLAQLQALEASGTIQGAEAQRGLAVELDNAKLAVARLDNSIGGGLKSTFLAMKMQVEDVGAITENILTSAFNSATDSILNFVKTGEFEIQSFLVSIADMILKSGIQKLLFNLFSAMGGGGGGGGILAGLFGNGAQAAGGAYDSGGMLTAYAKGGVTNGPELFAAGGTLGLRGEAGPESIMPLKRMGNGDLGVQSDGSGSGGMSAPAVNVAPAPVKVVVVNNKEEALAEMQSSTGEQIVMEHLSNNPGAVKRILS